jgi:hypothetical protein
MTNNSALLRAKGINEGVVVKGYYGNGAKSSDYKILEVGEYFVFVASSFNDYATRSRESHNSVLRYIKTGIWRIEK